MNIELSDDQRTAEDALFRLLKEQRREDVVLTGAAGCGKTTLMRSLIERVENDLDRACRLLTPTGKAALRLSQVTGRGVSTIHSALYPRAKRIGGELVWESPQEVCERGQVVVIDEASMVGSALYKDIHSKLPHRAQVLYVGDKEQLQPVNDTWGPSLDEPDALLTRVHRQAEGNPVLEYATAIRSGYGREWSQAYQGDKPELQVYEGYASAMQWTLDQFKAGRDATILTYTNKTRFRLNQDIRAGLGLVGDIVVGDRILVRNNNRDLGVMNGEVLTVELVEETESNLCGRAKVVHTERGSFLVNMDLFNGRNDLWVEWKQSKAKRDPMWVHCHHGFALTIHASQGSEWKRVGIVLDPALMRSAREDPDAGRRLMYTAVTRAAERLALFHMH